MGGPTSAIKDGISLSGGGEGAAGSGEVRSDAAKGGVDPALGLSMRTRRQRAQRRSEHTSTAPAPAPPVVAAAWVRVSRNREQASKSGGGGTRRPGEEAQHGGIASRRRAEARSRCCSIPAGQPQLRWPSVTASRQDDDTEDTRREAHGGSEHGAGPRKVHLPRHGAHLLQRPLCYLGGEVNIQMDISAEKMDIFRWICVFRSFEVSTRLNFCLF